MVLGRSHASVMKKYNMRQVSVLEVTRSQAWHNASAYWHASLTPVLPVCEVASRQGR